jgi:hypothetical protein
MYSGAELQAVVNIASAERNVTLVMPGTNECVLVVGVLTGRGGGGGRARGGGGAGGAGAGSEVHILSSHCPLDVTK